MAGKKVSKKSTGRKDMPVGVKISSVYYYIGAILALLLGIMLMFGVESVARWFESAGFEGITAGVSLIIGIVVFIAGAVLYFFVGRGLWKGQAWARIVAIIIGVLSIIDYLSQIASDTGNIFNAMNILTLIEVVIGGYLLFSAKAKVAFK